MPRCEKSNLSEIQSQQGDDLDDRGRAIDDTAQAPHPRVAPYERGLRTPQRKDAQKLAFQGVENLRRSECSSCSALT